MTDGRPHPLAPSPSTERGNETRTPADSLVRELSRLLDEAESLRRRRATLWPGHDAVGFGLDPSEVFPTDDMLRELSGVSDRLESIESEIRRASEALRRAGRR